MVFKKLTIPSSVIKLNLNPKVLSFELGFYYIPFANDIIPSSLILLCPKSMHSRALLTASVLPNARAPSISIVFAYKFKYFNALFYSSIFARD